MDAIDTHEHISRVKLIQYVAAKYGLPADRVHHIGRTDSAHTIRSVCGHKSHTALEPMDEFVPFVDFRGIIELKPAFEQVDNVLFTKSIVLAGQCPDCGEVLISEYFVSKH